MWSLVAQCQAILGGCETESEALKCSEWDQGVAE